MNKPEISPSPETPTRRPIEPPGRDLPPPSEPEISPSRRTAPEIFPERSPDATPPGENPTEPGQPLREIPVPGDPVVPPR